MQLWMSSGFPNPNPPFLDSVSMFLIGHLFLLPPLLCFLSMFEFYQNFIFADLVPPLFDFLHVRIDDF